MRFVYKGIGVLVGMALMSILLISSVEYVAYYMDGYFEKEYKKYQVAKSIDIEMNDLLEVTHEMMDYLKGDREDLVVYTKIGNIEQEFFNDKEKRHMLDVQKLFIGAEQLRLGAMLFSALAIGVILYFKKGYHLFQGIQGGIGIFFGLMGLLVALMVHDFNRYFIMFHHIFFNNDDWILNPKTDLLINIVPEGFFRDTAFWIAGIFLISALVVWLLSWFLAKRMKTGE
ncbi:TIGR01906 family membrane protein [Anaerotignum sp. MB30-C6]|uniref:TIGR01906 family membrane protein n=1 Tax=Anaerotignum sp. MB30-C6 TaxID=3070814 RepID=UPI0027DD3D9F|nr:TIGR01906 family membrane protein [Anaerotignum sp. MB30-C6]WMI81345.1 TIGR01906 family membrane protein [Anaerotignum sp. MB30-C6]